MTVGSYCPKEDVTESVSLLDCAGLRRSPATLSSFHEGRAPRNKGLRYPPDPPTVEEIIAVMQALATRPRGSGCARSSSCCGGPDCGSARRSRSQKAT
jgi:hypothetical protein